MNPSNDHCPAPSSRTTWADERVIKQLLTHFDQLMQSPASVQRLRRFILDLAVRGKLVPQNPNDEPASELLKRIAKEKARLVKAGESRRTVTLEDVTEDEEIFVIPEGWCWTRLGNIVTYMQRGKSPKYATGTGLSVISQKCVRWNGLDLSVAKEIEATSLENYEAYRFLRDEDLLWNSTGTGTIGRVVRVVRPPAKLVCDSHVTLVRCPHVVQEYIRTWLRSDHVYGVIEDRAAGSTKQVELTTGLAQNWLVPLPPLPEQHRIVAKVGELMGLCDRLEAAQTERETTRTSLTAASLARLSASEPDEARFREHAAFTLDNFTSMTTRPEQIKTLRLTILNLAVRGKLVPQDPRDEPAAELLQRIAKEKTRLKKAGKIRKQKAIPPTTEGELPFALPANWQWSRIAEIGLVSPRNEAADDIPASFIPMPMIPAEYGATCSHEIRQWGDIKKGYTHFAEGDVGLAKITPCFQNGKSVVFRNLIGGLGSGTTELHIVRPLFVDPDFIVLFLKCPDFIDTGIPKMTGTAGQKRIPAEYFAHSPFPLPPFAEQRRIVAKVDKLMGLCDRLEGNLEAGDDGRGLLADTLLCKAIRNVGIALDGGSKKDSLKNFTGTHELEML